MPSYCGNCKVDIGRKRSVQCGTCLQWFHLECEDISKEFFAILDKNRNLSYNCKACHENPPETLSTDAFQQEMRKEFSSLKKSINKLDEDVKSNHQEINSKFDSVISDIRKELSISLNLMKDEITEFKKQTNSENVGTKTKVFDLQLQNHLLHYRLHRQDIIVTGLSDNIINMNDTVVSLGAYLKVNITPSDILNAFYIKKKKSVLVKFNHVTIRDKIMEEYYRTKSLKRCDVEGGDVNTRIYLNDNYSTLANKLLQSCLTLSKDGKIKKFSIINRETPKTKITLPNGDTKTFTLNNLVKQFNMAM